MVMSTRQLLSNGGYVLMIEKEDYLGL